MTLREQFDRRWELDPKTGCHVWTAGRMARPPREYGSFYIGTIDGKPTHASAHCWIYEQEIGPIPVGHEVDHLCKNTLCCNPHHLEAVPALVNRHRTRLDLCRAGLHDLSDPANVRWDSTGQRRLGCRTCDIAKKRARRAEAARVVDFTGGTFVASGSGRALEARRP